MKRTITDHQFIEGTKFSTVIDLYSLDFDLRSVLNKYLERIELNFRTKSPDFFSNKAAAEYYDVKSISVKSYEQNARSLHD